MYNKPTWDVYKLKLEEQHLQADPAKCLAHLPQKTLSGVDPSQTLIVVFGKSDPIVCVNQLLYDSLTLGAPVTLRSPIQAQFYLLGRIPRVKSSH